MILFMGMVTFYEDFSFHFSRFQPRLQKVGRSIQSLSDSARPCPRGIKH